MNKKEEIRMLKKELAILKASHTLATEALRPYKDTAMKRGARMQVLFEYMKGKQLFIPSEMQSWFHIDGTPKA